MSSLIFVTKVRIYLQTRNILRTFAFRNRKNMQEDCNSGYRHILKYTGIFGSVQGVNIVAALVRNKFAAILLGPEGMGLASLLGAATTFLGQMTNLGISVSAVRQISAYHDEGNQEKVLHFVGVVRVWCLLAALLGILVCVVAGYWMLSPAVAFSTVGGGEMAILKGTRRLRSLAVVQSIAAIVSVLISVPLYWVYGNDAIVPVINLVAIASMLPVIWSGFRLYVPHYAFSSSVMGEGLSMLRLGIAFTLAAMAGSGTELLIRSWLESEAGLREVGLYNAGSLLTITYVGLVFAAMDNDFYPRLSAVMDARKANEMINRQMEILLLIVSPLLVVMIVCLPWIVRLLLSSDFLPIVMMVQIAAVAMVLKAATLPVAYLTLARGRSMAYLILETTYFVVFIPLIIMCYRQWGLAGTGIAILLAHIFDFIMIHLYAYKVFDYHLDRRTIYIIGAALIVVSTALWISQTFPLN